MVAIAMAHQDKATVEQRALINKLADEYADELNNLGVRVSALENKVGNVKLSGDARLRYRQVDGQSVADGYATGITNKDGSLSGEKKNDNSFDYRVRIRANAQVNDNTSVAYGISTNNVSFGNNDPASSDSPSTYTDLAKVDTKLGSDWTASVGRTDLYVLGGGYGYQYGDVFDRAQLTYNNGKFAATAGYGKFKENGGYVGSAATAEATGWNYDGSLNGVKTGYGELKGFFGNGSAVGVYYNGFNGSDSGKKFYADDLWGAYASVNFGQKFNFLTDYETVNFADNVKNENGDDNAASWVSRLTYGKAAMAQPKSWDLWVEYLDADQDAFLGGSSNSWRNFGQMDNLTSWGAGVDYTFAKNAMFSVMQSFGSSTKDGGYKDPEEVTKAQFVFAF